MPGRGKSARAKSGAGAAPRGAFAVNGRMGYIVALILVVLVVPLICLLLSRRTTGAGRLETHDRGMTVSRPSSDQPTPPAGPRTDRPSTGADHGVPPG
jgi:hypothetical protein